MTEQVQKPRFGGQFRTQARHSYRRRPGDMYSKGQSDANSLGWNLSGKVSTIASDIECWREAVGAIPPSCGWLFGWNPNWL